MKRVPLRRKTRLVRSSPLPKEGTSKPKREARTAKKRNSAHTKKWRQAVLRRDGHSCRVYVEHVPRADGSFRECGVTEDLHVHHLTYKRLGCELLEDGITLCRRHHEMLESRLRWYKSGRAP